MKFTINDIGGQIAKEDDRYTVGDRVYDDDIFIMGSTVNEENQYES